MDKLISLVATLVLLGLYKILEYFHLFKTLQLILVFLMICAFCYGISPNMGNRISKYHEIHFLKEKW